MDNDLVDEYYNILLDWFGDSQYESTSVEGLIKKFILEFKKDVLEVPNDAEMSVEAHEAFNQLLKNIAHAKECIKGKV